MFLCIYKKYIIYIYIYYIYCCFISSYGHTCKQPEHVTSPRPRLRNFQPPTPAPCTLRSLLQGLAGIQHQHVATGHCMLSLCLVGEPSNSWDFSFGFPNQLQKAYSAKRPYQNALTASRTISKGALFLCLWLTRKLRKCTRDKQITATPQAGPGSLFAWPYASCLPCHAFRVMGLGEIEACNPRLS